MDRPFNPECYEPTVINGWTIKPDDDWCWFESGDEYPCLTYELYNPDGKFMGSFGWLEAAIERIPEDKSGEHHY